MANLVPEESYAAEQLKEAIKAEETEVPDVNVEGDYERSQEFSVSSDDAGLAKFDSINEAGSFSNQSEDFDKPEEGNPENFMEMAQELSSKTDQ
jgi:phosphatidate phosphatase APP1